MKIPLRNVYCPYSIESVQYSANTIIPMCTIMHNMDIDSLKAVVVDQRGDVVRILGSGDLVVREGRDHWAPSVSGGLVKVVCGVRRCGKSVFTQQLLSGIDHAYVNFDDERLAGMKAGDLAMVMEVFHQLHGDVGYVLLDEIQNVQGWELFVNRLQRQGLNITVTGSNAKLLSDELATHLTGRYVPIRLHPFSFREFLTFRKVSPGDEYGVGTKTRAVMLKSVGEYLESGGFPEALKEPEMSRHYLPALFSDIVSRDVVGRFSVRNVGALREMAQYLVSISSNLITYRKLAARFDLGSPHTAKDYLGYLADASLFFTLDKFSHKHAERSRSAKKVYAIDTGLCRTVGFASMENMGPMMETLVAVELQRKKALEPAMEVYYWRDHHQREVDFVVKTGPEVSSLLQVTYCTDAMDLDPRETRALARASRELGCRDLTIITWDASGEVERDGLSVRLVPLWRWLWRGE